MTRRMAIDNNRARWSQRRRIRKVNTPIPFTFDQLLHYAETSFFYDMILYHEWLDCVYVGNDTDYNNKLQFIRRWWKDRVPDKWLVKNGKTHNFAIESKQLKLF